MEDDSCCCSVFLLPVLVVVILFALAKMFPQKAKTLRKKFSAWMMSKVMYKVHAKCSEQKAALFKALEKKGGKPHILEIGVGPGSNLDYYPKECVFECLEPNEENQKYLLKNLEKYKGIHFNKFNKGFAEDMGAFASDTFDAVVCTFVLCSVRDMDKALSEVKRVLKPGGHFLFLEHVAAPEHTFMRSLQNGGNYIWPIIADGCQLNLETWKSVEKAGFREVKQEQFQMKIWFAAIVKFALYGDAVK